MSEPVRTDRRSFAGIRVRVASSLGFDEVLAGLKSVMGEATVAEVVGLAAEVADAAAYERAVNQRFVGPSGFVLFAQIDHGAWIPLYGIRRRSVRLILGNPVIAITMIRHDITAGLFAPVELLLTEAVDGPGCTIDYVLPSSLIAVGAAAPGLLEAAERLDEKFEALVAGAADGRMRAPTARG